MKNGGSVHNYVKVYQRVEVLLGKFPSNKWINAERKTYVLERVFRTQGCFQWFYGSQKRPNPFFAPCKKDPLQHMEFLKKFSSSPGAKLAGFNLHNSFKTRQKKDPSLACRALFKGPKKRIRVWPAQRFLKPLKKGFHLRPVRPKAFCPNGSSQQHKATSNQTLEKSF